MVKDEFNRENYLVILLNLEERLKNWREKEQESLDKDGGHLIMTLEEYQKILGGDVADPLSQYNKKIEWKKGKERLA